MPSSSSSSLSSSSETTYTPLTPLYAQQIRRKKTNTMVPTMSTTPSAFISSPNTTLRKKTLKKSTTTNKRSTNKSLSIIKASISVADVTGPVKETIKDVQSVEVQNTMSFSFLGEFEY